VGVVEELGEVGLVDVDKASGGDVEAVEEHFVFVVKVGVVERVGGGHGYDPLDEMMTSM
jgi:hypothetical protein